MVSYYDCWMSVIVRRQQKELNTGWILTKLGRNDPYMGFINNC